MRLGATVGVWAACAAALVAATPASASHLAPSVAVSVVDLGEAPICRAGLPEGTVCSKLRGSRRVRVDWTSACGPEAPAGAFSAEESWVDLGIRPRNPARGPVVPRVPSGMEAPSGSREELVSPGRRVFARARVSCYDPGPERGPDEPPADERASAQADSAETVVVAPVLYAWELERGTFCGANGRDVPPRDRRRGIGASDFQTVNWILDFDFESMLMRPSVTGALKEVRLRAAGRGVRLRVGPGSGPLRKGLRVGDPVWQAAVFSPRSGKLRLWAEVGGTRTNVIRVPVVGVPCVRNPRSYYGLRGPLNPFVRN